MSTPISAAGDLRPLVYPFAAEEGPWRVFPGSAGAGGSSGTDSGGFLSFAVESGDSRGKTVVSPATGTVNWLEAVNSAREQLVNSIFGIKSSIKLGELHSELNRIEMERFLKLPSVPTLHESCTDYRDILAGKALVLVNEEMAASGLKQPQMPFALISMGSDGRKEQTLITDQDYLIVYGDGGGEEADVIGGNAGADEGGEGRGGGIGHPRPDRPGVATDGVRCDRH